MAHGDTIIDGDGVEFFGDAASRFNLATNHLPDIVEVNMARDKLSERVNHGNNWLAKILIGHARCPPEAPSARHVAAMCGCF